MPFHNSIFPWFGYDTAAIREKEKDLRITEILEDRSVDTYEDMSAEERREFREREAGGDAIEKLQRERKDIPGKAVGVFFDDLAGQVTTVAGGVKAAGERITDPKFLNSVKWIFAIALAAFVFYKLAPLLNTTNK